MLCVMLFDVAFEALDDSLDIGNESDHKKLGGIVVFVRQTPCPLQFANPQAPIIITRPLHVGILPRPALNGVAVEYDIIPDILPARSPTVIWNCRLLPVPYATIHAIDTSDLHSVASQDEKPTRSPAVCHIAKLVPVTVKLTDPVDPVLIDDTLD